MATRTDPLPLGVGSNGTGGKRQAGGNNNTPARGLIAKGPLEIGRCLLTVDLEAWLKDRRGLLAQPFDLAA